MLINSATMQVHCCVQGTTLFPSQYQNKTSVNVATFSIDLDGDKFGH